MTLLLWLLFDCVIVVATLFAAHELGWWAWWPATLIIGSRQHAIGELMHLAMHARSPLYKLLAYLLGMDPKEYRDFHLAHHRHLGNREKDPEIAVYAKWPERWLSPRWFDPWLDALGLHAREAFITFNRISTSRSMAPQVTVVAVLAWFWPIVLLWPASVFTGLMLCHRLRARTEHPLSAPHTTVKQQSPTRWQLFVKHVFGNRNWDHWAHHNPRAAA